MNKQEAEERQITIYWWNMGKKSLGFHGSYKDYLSNRDIKVKTIKHPSVKGVKGYRFIIPLSTSVCRLDSFSQNYAEDCIRAILVLLTLLGDKSIFRDDYNREYKINWR